MHSHGSTPLIPLDAVGAHGRDLARPECVLATRDGTLYVSDKRGGVTRIGADGQQRFFGQAHIVPNGIALLRDGSFLASSLEGEPGVWRITRDGRAEPWLTEVDGVKLGAVNFVRLDHQERVWVCVSATDMVGHTYPRGTATGYIALVDKKGSRIIARDLCFTNECVISADGTQLFVNETFARRLTRYQLAADGSLSGRATVTEFGHGVYPDGLALDVEGHVWIVSVVSNRVIRVAPDGRQELIIEDADPEHLDDLEGHFQAGTLTRPMLGANKGEKLCNTTSIAFAGPDLRTAFMGCLSGTTLATFRAPVAGLPAVHWDWSFPA